MRVLTVRQPWAWAIVHGGKVVENRSTNIAGSYRGPVAIHAGLEADPADDPRWLNAPLDGMPNADVLDVRGAIIGVVDLVSVHEVTVGIPPKSQGEPVCWDDSTIPGQTCSPWASPDPGWHLVLANPRPIAEPIQYTGGLGLRTLDEATCIAVWEAIA